MSRLYKDCFLNSLILDKINHGRLLEFFYQEFKN